MNGIMTATRVPELSDYWRMRDAIETVLGLARQAIEELYALADDTETTAEATAEATGKDEDLELVAQLVGRAPAMRNALAAIATMTITPETNSAELLALCIAVAQVEMAAIAEWRTS